MTWRTNSRGEDGKVGSTFYCYRPQVTLQLLNSEAVSLVSLTSSGDERENKLMFGLRVGLLHELNLLASSSKLALVFSREK